MAIKDQVLEAAKAEAIPAGARGIWVVRKCATAKPIIAEREKNNFVTVPPGNYTYLACYTAATLHLAGDTVMHDTPDELQTHLNFMLRAKGRVLITGLGLGCVVRGCLANPAVSHVTCIERSLDVLHLVAPYMPSDRLSIIHADALDWTARHDVEFDCAWHDLWSNPDRHEEHLQLMHTRLICNMHGKVKFQGAWAMPREHKRQFESLTSMV